MKKDDMNNPPGDASGKNEESLYGVVVEALPNTLFRVKIADNKEILAYLAGKMRLHRIRVMVGDKVELIPDSYGNRGRIVRRH